MDQPPSRIHLGKATRQIAKSLIRLPERPIVVINGESTTLFSKQEYDAIGAELYWFRLTALQLVLVMHMQDRQATLNLYEARYMMATAIELAFQDADLSRRDTTKIRSKLSEEMDYYFGKLELSKSPHQMITSSDIVGYFVQRTLAICTAVQAVNEDRQEQESLAKEATVIWDQVLVEVEQFLKSISIIEFEK